MKVGPPQNGVYSGTFLRALPDLVPRLEREPCIIHLVCALTSYDERCESAESKRQRAMHGPIVAQ